jgi:hypothetical protein
MDQALDLRVAEQVFLSRWPGYREWLDETRVRAAIAPALSTARRREVPFPHLVAQPFLPDEFYRMLNDAWPPLSVFRRSQKGRKFELEPRSDLLNDASALYSTLPACFRDVWDFFTQVVNLRIVGPWLSEVFKAEIDGRFAQVAELKKAATTRSESALVEPGTYQANVGRLMMRGPGYTLPAHVDPFHLLVTVLHYFNDGETLATCGTALFKAERPLPADVLVAGGSKYFKDYEIATEEIERAPFVANGLLAFPNLLNAAHGAAGPEQGLRRVFQYHVSLRDRSEPL